MPKLPSEADLVPVRARRRPEDDPAPTDADPPGPVFDDMVDELPEDLPGATIPIEV